MPLYDSENPHPGYGKDPNIINELGHSIYPKFVFPKGLEPKEGEKPDFSKRVIVNNPAEEAKVTGVEIKEKNKSKNSQWN